MENKTAKLPQRKIGTHDVPCIGLGLMGMSSFYPHGEDPETAEKKHLDVLTKAADAGEVFWDTSDMYGPFTNEELVGKWFKQTGRRKEIFLCTKFGIKYNYETGQMDVRGDREYVRECVDASLKRLQTDYIDLYYQHRVDKNTKIEDTVAAMAELVKEGRVKYLGLSECSEKTLRRGHAIHPITAVQIEYSLFTLDIERPEIGIKKACDELGIAIVAYSPLGRGMLTGQIKSRADLKADDFRMVLPRFSEENFPNNIKLVDKVVEIATKKGVTPGQVALAWLLKQGNNIIPIPGTKQFERVQENLGAVKVELTEEENQFLRDAAEKAEVKGERYPLALVSSLFADSA